MSTVTDKDRELVLCVSRPCVERLFRGVKGPWLPNPDGGILDVWLARATVAFLPRSIAEHSPDWLHICTYAVLDHGDHVFAYRRGESGSEGRLHGALSLGVGGHVDIDDYHFRVDNFMVANAALREIGEELDTGSATGFRLAGLIADDSTPCNRVHLGAVYRMAVNRSRVRVREDCLADPQWLTRQELTARESEMETWSRIVLDNLFSGAHA